MRHPRLGLRRQGLTFTVQQSGAKKKKALAFARGPFLSVSYLPGPGLFPPNVEGPVPLNVVGPPAVPFGFEFAE